MHGPFCTYMHDIQLQCYYTVVLIGHMTDLARSSLCPSVRHPPTRKKAYKNKIGMNVPEAGVTGVLFSVQKFKPAASWVKKNKHGRKLQFSDKFCKFPTKKILNA